MYRNFNLVVETSQDLGKTNILFVKDNWKRNKYTKAINILWQIQENPHCSSVKLVADNAWIITTQMSTNLQYSIRWKGKTSCIQD